MKFLTIVPRIQTLRLMRCDANLRWSVSHLQGQERTRGQRPSGLEEIWPRLQPVVECGDHAMTLTVRRRRAVQLLLDQGEAASTPALTATVVDGSPLPQYETALGVSTCIRYTVNSVVIISASCG